MIADSDHSMQVLADGLAGLVFSHDLRTAWRTAEELEAGASRSTGR
ncbi:MAG: hypothetical protein ACRDMJ_18435 [Solirubrobacteraceae bacterium]